MKPTCTQCGDQIDLEAWPIVVVVEGEPALFCGVQCHDRWRDTRANHPPAASQ